MSCFPGSKPLTNQEWIRYRFSERCYFYPARDCPGWLPGGTCSRIGDIIPEGEPVKWVIVVSHSDRSGIIGVYGPYSSESIAKSMSEWLQSLPGSMYSGGLWENLPRSFRG